MTAYPLGRRRVFLAAGVFGGRDRTKRTSNPKNQQPARTSTRKVETNGS
jgi:hypothetical protein